MQSIMGFNLSYVAPSDGQWGSQLGNGSWVGLVGMLERKEVDIVSAPLTAILERFV